MYNSNVRSTKRDKMTVNKEGSNVHVARPEDGTEIIDEADNTGDDVMGDVTGDDVNITEESGDGALDTSTNDTGEEANGGKRRRSGKVTPFKDLVVYIWKSWKIIIGKSINDFYPLFLCWQLDDFLFCKLKSFK